MAEHKNGEESSARGQGDAAPHTTKKHKVAAARKALGPEAKRAEVRKYILDTFHEDIHPDHISNILGELRREERGKESPAPAKPAPAKEKAKPAAAAPAEPATAAAEPASESSAPRAALLGSKDIQIARDLVTRLGIANAKKLLDLVQSLESDQARMLMTLLGR